MPLFRIRTRPPVRTEAPDMPDRFEVPGTVTYPREPTDSPNLAAGPSGWAQSR